MKYTKPVAELEKFELVDVITTSTTVGGGGDDPFQTPDVE